MPFSIRYAGEDEPGFQRDWVATLVEGKPAVVGQPQGRAPTLRYSVAAGCHMPRLRTGNLPTPFALCCLVLGQFP